MRLQWPATIVIGLGLAAVLTLVIGTGYLRSFEGGRSISVIGEARVGAPFSLVDQRGRVVSDSTLRGQVVLLHFGYTGSAHETPAALQVMVAVIEVLGTRGEQVTPVFITLDPVRDTRAALGEFSIRFHPRLRALTGSASEIDAVAKAFHVRAVRVADISAPEGYSIEHPALIYLLDRNGRFVEALEPETGVRNIVPMIAKLL